MEYTFSRQIITSITDSIRTFTDRNAFCIDERFYTYAEFGDRISKIRAGLAARCPVSKNVGLVANDDLDTYSSIIALWMEGMSYTPLHPNQPIERCNDILEQVGADLILDSSTSTRYPVGMVLLTSECREAFAGSEQREYADGELAYILFTSGSTGKPKGVQITRENVAAFMAAFWRSGITIDETDRCLQCFDLTFDVSVQSYLVPLSKGACVYTIPHEQIKYTYIYGLLEDHKLTFGAMAPSMLRYLRPYFDEIDAPYMRYCIVTAEASPLNLIQEWNRHIPNAEIFDFYGPTEATIYCTYYKVPRTGSVKALNGMLCIGKPFDGVEAIIIDDNQRVLPAGEKGELCIAGPQLTTGYWNNPQKDAEAFFEMEYKGAVRRFYHTGDLCYFDTDGDLLYSGRLDFQAKIQGYRVELGEIEFHAREFMGETNAIAVAFENAGGNAEIALWLETTEADQNGLLRYMRSKMPSYMIPSVVRMMREFPLNSNGKIDRPKLKALL